MLAHTLLYGVLLAACQHLPSSVPFMDDSTARAAELTAALAAPVERQWPDAKQDVLNQRARGYGLVRMPEMQQYLDRLLARIKTQAGVATWPGNVYVLAASPLDAYATAAGNIYISQSWLSSMESEDEVVALLSHEFGHIYLHYHQLEGAVLVSEKMATVSAITLAVVKKTAQASGWTPVDSLIVSYSTARDLLSSAWGRSQESAADVFGMNISMKMGYTYDAGFKTLLERIATWEDQNTKRQAELAQALLTQMQAEAKQSIVAKNTEPQLPITDAILNTLGDINAALTTAVHEGSIGISSVWGRLTSKHPDTVTRMDSLASAIEALPPDTLPEAEATLAPWEQALKQPRTAKILSNYAASIRALNDLADANALLQAQVGVTGDTATHALPLHVLYLAQRANGEGQKTRVDGAALLDRNIKAKNDRAWIIYYERAQQLNATGKKREAKAILDSGFKYFHNAANVWPRVIAFYGENQSWPDAKKLAAECIKRFENMAEACRNAATTPAEKAEADRRSKQKAEQIVEKLKLR